MKAVVKEILIDRNIEVKKQEIILDLVDAYIQSKPKTKAGFWIRFIVSVLPVKFIISILKSKIKKK